MTTKTSAKTSLIQLGVAIAIAAPFIGWYAIHLSSDSSSDPAIFQTQVGTNSGITLDRYEQVKAGMSISTVETIVGEGKEMSRVEMAGAPLTISYSWQNADGSNMVAMFQDNKLISKAQALLK